MSFWRRVVLGYRPFKSIGAWVYSRQGDVASWWTHERILQAWTLLCYAAFATWGADAVAASLAALGGVVYWVREVEPAIRDRPRAPVDTLLDYASAWWGIFETILMWYGAEMFIRRALGG